MKPTYQELEAKCAALAAENAGLKDEISNITFMRDDDFFGSTQRAQEVMGRLVNVKTPATDAFLAEVRAQVWIEGNEPAEFGRYWVRYETDVGPRYCSAQWLEHNFCAGSDTNIHRIWFADHSRAINSLRGVTHYTQLPTALESSQLRKGVQS
ncbi:hypothetical protein [Enterobacter kobei]|uniref:hypothetical protein n=1 Tax=Enterobacter kobei TaxID=208224 RepID=UPI000B12A8B6|nr:hypothetical protein [Enterobacter kobei]